MAHTLAMIFFYWLIGINAGWTILAVSQGIAQKVGSRELSKLMHCCAMLAAAICRIFLPPLTPRKETGSLLAHLSLGLCRFGTFTPHWNWRFYNGPWLYAMLSAQHLLFLGLLLGPTVDLHFTCWDRWIGFGNNKLVLCSWSYHPGFFQFQWQVQKVILGFWGHMY